MEQKQIEEGNRLIALFDGYEETIAPHLIKYKEVIVNTNQLQYNKSWDWLMPVVEKIPAPDYRGYRIEIVVQGYVKIEGYPMPTIFTNVSQEGGLLPAVWKAVIEFIKWNDFLKQANQIK